MKNFIQILMLTSILLVTFSVNSFASYKQTKFTIYVVNEADEPLSDIRVGVGFEKNLGWKTESSGQHGTTSSDGKLTFSGQSNGHITYGGSHDGYYPSYYDFDFKDSGAFGWEPWNPEIKIVMRKIENPVAMYARNTKEPHNGILIPVVGQDVGFDLIEYDWVAPYGSGKESDFIFNLDSHFIGNRNYDYTIKIKFTERNGLIKIRDDLSRGSNFPLPRFAPVDGYRDSLDIYVRRLPNGPIERSEDMKNHYIFRIRSVLKDGNVENGMYGKILRDIWVHPRQDGRARIAFKYYINPDGTRNLEFDQNRNLFSDLPTLERVGIK